MERENIHAPLVSVVMPAYNAENYIACAVESVLAQSMGDLELIVLDDGSSDNTAEIVAQIAMRDNRVRLCPNEHNMGTARTRNRGLDLCRGMYAAFLDSDDIWYPKKLEKQLHCMQQTGADLSYAAYAIVDIAGQKCCADYRVPQSIDLEGLLKENVIGCSTVMLSRSAMEQYRFQPEYYHEDYVMWLQMLQDGRAMAGVDEVLVDYRYHAGSRAGNKVASAKYRWQIYRGCMKLSWWKSVWYMSHYAVAGLKKYKVQRN